MMTEKSKKILMVVLGVVFVGGVCVSVSPLVRNRQAPICVHQMAAWQAAAESYCLDNGVGPEDTLTLERLAPLLEDGGKGQFRCPVDKVPYAPFRVAYGPVCPNGHPFRPDVPRPFEPLPGTKMQGIYDIGEYRKSHPLWYLEFTGIITDRSKQKAASINLMNKKTKELMFLKVGERQGEIELVEVNCRTHSARFRIGTNETVLKLKGKG